MAAIAAEPLFARGLFVIEERSLIRCNFKGLPCRDHIKNRRSVSVGF
jgi:hypothetical protein